MTTAILFTGLAIALALYVRLAKNWLPESWRRGPGKAKKQEKSEIIRQLLALSDRENSIAPAASPVRSGTPRTNRPAHAGKLRSSRQRFVSSSRKA